MKKCPNCNVSVGGMMDSCPLCQHALTGEGTPYNWPALGKFKTQAFLFKLQLFIVLAVVAVALLLDLRLNVNTGKHISLVIGAWCLSFEWLLYDFLRKRVVVSKIITVCTIYISVLLWVTGWYLGFMEPIRFIVVPSLISAAIIANLVFALVDKSGNSLVYFLSTIVLGVMPYIILALCHFDDIMLPWTICLMITVVAFLAIIVFRGRKVLSEVQKRMNF